jgi:propionyl-CoA carboxylase alpha chain
MGDSHGNVVHLFERECSIQRRHQKIVEESPSPALDDPARAELCGAAVTAAKAIGYVNAGTVEFLMLEDGSFAFLEVNTRLQVEHPVTEFVTGLDLVRLQLLVAEGGELPEQARFASIRGHAIEVRLYAEDPTNDWRPSVGRLRRFRIGSSVGSVGSVGSGGSVIRVDTGVEDGSVISPWYDPMLAKVIAFSPTRLEAARALASALATAQIHGVTTNRDLLVRICRHPEFLAGDIDTGFLVRHDPAELGAPLASADSERLHAIAAAMAAQAARRSSAKVLGGLPSGWRNNPSQPQHEQFIGSRGVLQVDYRFDRTGRCSEIVCNLEGASEMSFDVEVMSADTTRVVLSAGSVVRAYDVDQAGPQTYVDGPDGSSVLTRVARFPLPGSQLDPGSLVAPLPGTVVRVHVAEGDEVSAGDVLVAIEAMKMEHEIRAGHAGVVGEVAVAAGDQVEAGRLLVVINESEPTTGD